MAYREGSTAQEKRSMFKRLFSSDSQKSKSKEEKHDKEKDKKKLSRGHTIANPSTRTKDDSGGAKAERKSSRSDSERKSSSKQKQSSNKSGRKGGKRKKTQKKKANIDTSKPLEWPCEPELIMEYHKAKPFLTPNEEWFLVELNEFECLVDSQEIISIMAQHTKYTEMEPDEYLEEFFEFVDDVSTYDEIINYDVWQEFRDVKYPC